jgi:hypothetical protein
MAHNRSRFVLLCQQTLALGLVVALAAPATDLVTLDIVAPPAPGTAVATDPAVAGSRTGDTRNVLSTAPVRPTVSTVSLTGVTAAGLRALRQQRAARTGVRLTAAGTDDTAPDDLAVLSAPQPVDGLATIGVTWSSTDQVGEHAISISVRTRANEVWSAWQEVHYHAEEGPDPDSSEGRAARPGTDPVYVGDVDDVQIKATADSGRPPTGMQLSLVDPGAEQAPPLRQPADDADEADDTARLSAAPTAARAAGSVTHKPRIYSRAGWGADERMRDKSSLRYGEVHGGFVHHTVNANAYSRAQVPSIIRGIYAYHTQSRGWSDVGYNFLVDRFGRIWEGRYGGIRRPVVGAHTLGYNEDAFAGSAIGNFDIARPPAAVVRAFARLFAWKLSLHGIRAGSTRQFITSRSFPAINGHRDAGQTACPGRYLYARIPRIRALAASYQRSWAGRERGTGVAGSGRPVVVARGKVGRQLYLIRTRASGGYARTTPTGAVAGSADLIINAGDWDGDGRGDVITRSGTTGLLWFWRGLSGGKLAPSQRMAGFSFGRVGLLAAVGDMTGDGRPDLIGQPSGRAMRIYPGNGQHGFSRSFVAHSALSGRAQLGVGLWNRGGAPDTVVRRSSGSLVLYPGNGPGGLTGGTTIGRLGASYDWLVAVGDLTGDNRADLIARSTRTDRLWTIPGARGGFAPRQAFAPDMSRFDIAG